MYARYTRKAPPIKCKKTFLRAPGGHLYVFYKLFTSCQNNLDFRKFCLHLQKIDIYGIYLIYISTSFCLHPVAYNPQYAGREDGNLHDFPVPLHSLRRIFVLRCMPRHIRPRQCIGYRFFDRLTVCWALHHTSDHNVHAETASQSAQVLVVHDVDSGAYSAVYRWYPPIFPELRGTHRYCLQRYYRPDFPRCTSL